MSSRSTSVLAQAPSVSSSGFADGLGSRLLGFDREAGVMLERLVLRPELAAFERLLRDTLERAAAVEDERIARPRSLEREGNGSLVVISEFVPGSRLADLLETSSETGTVPGIDAALGFLLDVLPALCGLHAGAGLTHGAISPARIVLTSEGQLVLLDSIYAAALTRLGYSRARLWDALSIATPATAAAAPVLDVEADLAQAALAAVMLVIGRPLREDEYPDGLITLLRDVVEVAQIRGGNRFAEDVQAFFHRALPLPFREPYSAADDALFDARALASELGVDVCRRALTDFVDQMEIGTAARPEPDGGHGFLDEDLLEIVSVEDEPQEEAPPEPSLGTELDLDSLASEAEYNLDSPGDATGVEPLSGPREEALDWSARGNETLAHAAAPSECDADVLAAPEAEFLPAPEASAAEASTAQQDAVPSVSTPLPLPDPPALAPEAMPAAAPAPDAEPAIAPAAAAPATPARSRRAKRGSKSARARKDKLRSAAAEADAPLVQEPASAPEPPPLVAAPSPRPQPAETWLIAPDRAAAFEPPLPPPTPVPQPAASLPAAPAPITPAATPLVPEPAFSRTVPPQIAVAPSYEPPPAWNSPAPSPAVTVSSLPQLVPLKLKDAPRKRLPAIDTAAEVYAPVPPPAQSTPSVFPWRLAGGLVGAVAIAIVAGRLFLPTGTTASESAPAAPPPAAAPASASPVAAPTGRLELETQPAGARVLIDGKPAGETPVALDRIPAGRHTVTLIAPAGTVKRTVRIEPGRTARLDIPIYSGWVGIYAPFVLEVSESGRVLGTTEEPRLMLSPGKHTLTLTNRELGYNSTHAVDVEPGEVRSISIDPRGAINVNATPWAEVWVDGRKLGDTPLANAQLPLGTREVRLRHPQLGERRIPVTVRADAPAAISVDLTKPGL